MEMKKLTASEAKFADIIWAHAPLTSMELAQLAETEMCWKKTTAYTVLATLCKKGLFSNENTVVSVVLTKDAYNARQSETHVEETYGGSLPKFLSAFIQRKKLSREQVEEIRRLIDGYEEE